MVTVQAGAGSVRADGLGAGNRGAGSRRGGHQIPVNAAGLLAGVHAVAGHSFICKSADAMSCFLVSGQYSTVRADVSVKYWPIHV